MTTIERSIVIDAPLKDVWAYIEDPSHLPEIWPSMVEVKDVESLPKGGRRYHWRYKMAGMRFEGDSETVDFEPERHMLQRNTGQIPSTFDWTFTPENGSTRIALQDRVRDPGEPAREAREALHPQAQRARGRHVPREPEGSRGAVGRRPRSTADEPSGRLASRPRTRLAANGSYPRPAPGSLVSRCASATGIRLTTITTSAIAFTIGRFWPCRMKPKSRSGSVFWAPAVK